ncbi:MAG: hypothetical protein IRZ16_08100 [Myxococcaceae bacterium]|nr:hypothetical protein [Myxococcaceae bacterium]
MKWIATVGLALLLLTVESVAVKYLGFSVTRIDVTVTIIAFLALRAAVVQGAVCSFLMGYLLDVMSGRPTGLYVFLAVLVFLLGRFANNFVDVGGRASFAVFAMGLDALHMLLALSFTWMASRDAGAIGFSIGGLVLQVCLTGLASVLLFPLLKKVVPEGSERTSEIGLLR